MTTIVDTALIQTPDAGVVNDARARQRRHRGIAAASMVVAAGIAAIVVASGGGPGNLSRTGGSLHPSATPASAPFEESSSSGGTLVLTKKGRGAPATATAGGLTVRAGELTSSKVKLTALQPSGLWEAGITMSHTCGKDASSCVWFGEASQNRGSQCPQSYDPTHAIWTGPIQQTAGTEQATVTFRPLYGLRGTTVCVYAQPSPPSTP
jgi:hypothetical protein